jgi:hypothetical protein
MFRVDARNGQTVCSLDLWSDLIGKIGGESHMQIEEYNPGYSFRVGGASYGRLCRYISTLPGVFFINRRRFFWSVQDVGVDFTFQEQKFRIDTDPWDYALWILASDMKAHQPEMQAIREHIEREHSRRALSRYLRAARSWIGFRASASERN